MHDLLNILNHLTLFLCIGIQDIHTVEEKLVSGKVFNIPLYYT